MLSVKVASVHLIAAFALLGCSAGGAAAPTAPVAAPATATPAISPAPQGSLAADQRGWEVIGTSLQGKPIRMRSLGHGQRQVLFIGGIHGDEPEGAYSTAQLPDAFIEAGLAETVTLTIVEDANPDGRAAGTRANANGVDVNRNFPASNFDTSDPANGSAPLSQPESRAVVAALERVRPALILVAHAWAGRQFVNYDGPAQQIAEQFSEASGLPVEPSNAFAPTPGSLGSYVGRDRGIPILTIEVLKGSDPEQLWAQLRGALLQAIAGRTE